MRNAVDLGCMRPAARGDKGLYSEPGPAMSWSSSFFTICLRSVLLSLIAVCIGCGSGGDAGVAQGAPGSTPVIGTHQYTKADAMVEVVDGPTDGHKATLDTRLYVPDNATSATPQPAIV